MSATIDIMRVIKKNTAKKPLTRPERDRLTQYIAASKHMRPLFLRAYEAIIQTRDALEELGDAIVSREGLPLADWKGESESVAEDMHGFAWLITMFFLPVIEAYAPGSVSKAGGDED